MLSFWAVDVHLCVCMCVCVCVCVGGRVGECVYMCACVYVFIYTISISIFCVSWEKLSITESLI